MRAVALAVLVAVLGGLAVGVAAPARADAQEVAMRKVDLAEPGAAAPAADAGARHSVVAVFFWLFALITIGGAVAMVTRRNAVTAVMSLVGSFLGLAALYAMLYAHFVAVIQVLVYAGAIMVLFVFVVMILNKEEEEPWALRGVIGKALAGLALLYFVVRLIQILLGVPAVVPEPTEALPATYGTTQGMADMLFSSYLFPFEAVSLVLLIAVVGALVLAHPGHPNVGEEEERSS
jgi:NADH-quinone oxidoreductase subunit J